MAGHTGLSLLVALALYIATVAFRRLYLNPLSKFPGPPLAAITTAYEMYFDLIVSGGMLRHIEKLHKKYGPVVRIGPNQLHFSDSAAYFDIYAQGSTLTKDPRLYEAFTLKSSLVTMTNPTMARNRRDMIQPFFSRRAILDLEEVIQQKVDKLVSRLKQASLDGKPIDVHLAFRSATHDIIASYCFSECFDILDAPNFDHPIMTAVIAQMPAIWVLKHFPWLTRIPAGPIIRRNKGFQALTHIRGMLARQIDSYLSDDTRFASAEHETIYHHLIAPLDKRSSRYEQLSRDELSDEAVTLISAGSDTVGQTCTAAIFYALSDPAIYRRLLQELKEAWPEKDQQPRLAALEKLPYLTAVIKEAMRLATGIVTPLPRVVNTHDMVIGGYVVPFGTVVAMGHTFVHNNPAIFPDPRSFKPERWLERRDLDSYLITFSRGPRMCPGTNLAWAELYMIIANTLRHLDVKVYNTTTYAIYSPDDMENYREFFAPYYRSHFHAFVSERQD